MFLGTVLPLADAATVGVRVVASRTGYCRVLLGAYTACLWLSATSCNVAVALTAEA